ncbi:MAG: hypothetical protein LDL07_02565 [Desulfarculus sp.]|nr:hypothetical protein [Desulfarculus sp.]
MTLPSPRSAFFGPQHLWLLWPLAAAALASCLAGLRVRGRSAWRPWPFRGILGRLAGWLLLAGLGLLALGSLLWNLHRLVPFLSGGLYADFALSLDLAAGLALIATLLCALARNPRRAGPWLLLILTLLTLLSGLLLEAGRLAALRPDGAGWEPLGWWLSQFWAWGGPSDRALHWLWWAHVGLALTGLGLWPWLAAAGSRAATGAYGAPSPRAGG